MILVDAGLGGLIRPLKEQKVLNTISRRFDNPQANLLDGKSDESFLIRNCISRVVLTIKCVVVA